MHAYDHSEYQNLNSLLKTESRFNLPNILFQIYPLLWCFMSLYCLYDLALLYIEYIFCVGIEKPAEVQVMFNSSMSEGDFFKWLQVRGVSEKDCKTLSGKAI